MPKIVKYNDWTAKNRMAQIRRQNVERHTSFEATQQLRDRIMRHQVNQTHEMEYQRLLASSVQGNLQQLSEERLQTLKNLLVK